MRYFIIFFIVIVLVYANSGFCITPPIEMTLQKNEDDDFAFFLQRVDENIAQVKGQVWLVLTVFPKKPGKWEAPETWINVFNEKEFIVRVSINESEEGIYDHQLGKVPEGVIRYFFMINQKYLEHSFLSYTISYFKDIEKKIENGGLLKTKVNHMIVTHEYILKFKDFINTKE